MSVFSKLKSAFQKVFAKPEEIIKREGGIFDGGRTHTVVKGDTLSHLALKYYGNSAEYNKIFEANRDVLSDPDKIYVGQLLRIPEKD